MGEYVKIVRMLEDTITTNVDIQKDQARDVIDLLVDMNVIDLDKVEAAYDE